MKRFLAALHMSLPGRLCCKSLKTPGDKFPARSRNKPRSLIDVASGSLPKSPVSLSPGDEVPHMFTRKPRLQLEKFAINGAKSQNPTLRCELLHIPIDQSVLVLRLA
jgi:hypothetical protein